MNEGMTLRRQRRAAPSKDQLHSLADFILRRSHEIRDQGLRFDWSNLSETEQAELLDLTHEAEGEQQGFDLGRLSSRKRRTWEKLVGQALGSVSFYEDLRKREEIAQLARDAQARSVRRPFKAREEVGLLGVLAGSLRSGHLHTDHITLLMVILLQVESGVALASNSVVERRGQTPVFVIDPVFGPVNANRDPYGNLARWQETIRWLEENRWLNVDRQGNRWAISLGAKMTDALAALDRAAAKTKTR
jgi:hypothetical protein